MKKHSPPKPISQVFVQVVDGPNPLYSAESAATMLGLPNAETVRKYCRAQEVFQPGTEAIKVGKYWSIDVAAFRKRMAKEQGQVRRV